MRYQNKGPFGIQDNYKNNILEAANQKFPNEQIFSWYFSIKCNGSFVAS